MCVCVCVCVCGVVGCRPRPRAGAGAGVRPGGEPVPQHLLLRCMVTMAPAEPAHRVEPANARLCVPVCRRRAIYLLSLSILGLFLDYLVKK